MIWIGLLLSLASCKDSLEAITLGGDELPTEGVTLSIQLPNFTPQEISTRAGGETTESITSLWLVCYGTSDNYLDMIVQKLMLMQLLMQMVTGKSKRTFLKVQKRYIWLPTFLT